MIIVIVKYHAEIVIDILIVDRLSPCPGSGWKVRMRSIVASALYELERQQVISTNKCKK